MAFFKTLTQGGQVHLHQLRMLKQVLFAGVVVFGLIGGGLFLWKSSALPFPAWQIVYETYWARFMLASTPVEKHASLTQLYTPPQGLEVPDKQKNIRNSSNIRNSKPYQRPCLSILRDPFLQRVTKQMEDILKQIAYESLLIATLVFLSLMGFWFFFGRSQKKAHLKRGNTLLPWEQLIKQLKKSNQDSDLGLFIDHSGNQEKPRDATPVSPSLIKKFPLLKDKETSHMLITGTTGAGKTNTFHHLLPQIRHRGDRAIILDVTGDYVSRYYDETTDKLLNPFDIRSENWHPWADCHQESHYEVLAESFIQTKEGNRDPFWDNASRVVFKTALRKYATQGNTNIEALTSFLLSASDKEFEGFFLGTEAATFVSQRNEKTTHSIRSVLSSQIESLRQLELAKEVFSIRDWIRRETPNSWLFLTARPDQQQTLTPLISAWLDIAVNGLMTLSPNSNRRLWFVMDELAALQKLPRLPMGLAEGRKYGGCFLVGFQSKPQLEDIYGRNAADSMLDLFNTKLFFRCTEPSTQHWISKVLGDKEVSEPMESISFGADSLRDGVSLSHAVRQKPLILPTELSQLKDLEGYLKLPGDLPCTKLQLVYQPSPFEEQEQNQKDHDAHKALAKKVESFILKLERKQTYAAQPSVKELDPSEIV